VTVNVYAHVGVFVTGSVLGSGSGSVADQR
jgi:hypothetical protein